MSAPAAVRQPDTALPARQPGYPTITVPAELLAAYVALFRVAESGAAGRSGADGVALRAACAAVRQAGG